MEIFGLTMLEDLPPERDTVTKFAWEKFGYPQFTQYGDSFEVRNKSGPSNVAYTGKTLGLHLDQPIYTNRLESTHSFSTLGRNRSLCLHRITNIQVSSAHRSRCSLIQDS